MLAMASSTDSMSSAPDPVELLRDLLRFDTTNPPGSGALVCRARPWAALGCGNRERALRARAGASQSRGAAARLERPLATPPLRPRRRRPYGGPAMDTPAVFGRDRRRDGVGTRRARHEIGRGDDDHGVPAGEGGEPRASRRRRPCRALRRGGRRRFRGEVPRPGASRRPRPASAMRSARSAGSPSMSQAAASTRSRWPRSGCAPSRRPSAGRRVTPHDRSAAGRWLDWQRCFARSTASALLLM